MNDTYQRFVNVIKNEGFKVVSISDTLYEVRVRATALQGKSKRVFDIFYDGKRARLVEILARIKGSTPELNRKMDSCCFQVGYGQWVYPFTDWYIDNKYYLAFQYFTDVEGKSPSSAVTILFEEYFKKIVNQREALYKDIFKYMVDKNLFYYPDDIFKIDFL